MAIFPEADKLENLGISKYGLVTLAAKRAKQIKAGANLLIETTSRNSITIALEEIAAGKITTEVLDSDEPRKTAEELELAELLPLGKADEDSDEEDSDITPTADDLDIEEEEEEEEEDVIPLDLGLVDDETDDGDDESEEEEEKSDEEIDLGDIEIDDSDDDTEDTDDSDDEEEEN